MSFGSLPPSQLGELNSEIEQRRLSEEAAHYSERHPEADIPPRHRVARALSRLRSALRRAR